MRDNSNDKNIVLMGYQIWRWSNLENTQRHTHVMNKNKMIMKKTLWLYFNLNGLPDRQCGMPITPDFLYIWWRAELGAHAWLEGTLVTTDILSHVLRIWLSRVYSLSYFYYNFFLFHLYPSLKFAYEGFLEGVWTSSFPSTEWSRLRIRCRHCS